MIKPCAVFLILIIVTMLGGVFFDNFEDFNTEHWKVIVEREGTGYNVTINVSEDKLIVNLGENSNVKIQLNSKPPLDMVVKNVSIFNVTVAPINGSHRPQQYDIDLINMCLGKILCGGNYMIHDYKYIVEILQLDLDGITIRLLVVFELELSVDIYVRNYTIVKWMYNYHGAVRTVIDLFDGSTRKNIVLASHPSRFTIDFLLNGTLSDFTEVTIHQFSLYTNGTSLFAFYDILFTTNNVIGRTNGTVDVYAVEKPRLHGLSLIGSNSIYIYNQQEDWGFWFSISVDKIKVEYDEWVPLTTIADEAQDEGWSPLIILLLVTVVLSLVLLGRRERRSFINNSRVY